MHNDREEGARASQPTPLPHGTALLFSYSRQTLLRHGGEYQYHPWHPTPMKKPTPRYWDYLVLGGLFGGLIEKQTGMVYDTDGSAY